MVSMKGLYHAQRGHDDILRQHLVFQRRQIKDAIWRPIIVFLLAGGAGLWILASLCDSWGLK